jgi:hypothetical protein
MIWAISAMGFASAVLAILRPSIATYFAAAAINAVAGYLVFGTQF